MLQTNPICKDGPAVSPLVAGFWRLQHWQKTTAELDAYVQQLLELGVTTMDHAWVYRSEAPFGQMLKANPGLRSQMQIVTKCSIRPLGFGPLGAQATNHYDASASYITASVEDSLSALHTDYVDVLLLHRPDYLMDVHEVAEAFGQLKAAGKVRTFGVSNFSTAQLSELRQVWPELVTQQVEFSPVNMGHLDTGVFNQCGELGIRPMLWSCLAGGQLFDPQNDKCCRIQKALKHVAEQTGAISLDAVVFTWVSALPCQPLPIVGTQHITRVKTAIEGLQLTLTREQWYHIWEASNGAPVP